jgi:Skp family chaperone for outer membrane proteins
MNSRRMNRLEELGRVDAERADTRKGARNLRDEKSRIVRELKATGGIAGKRSKIQEKIRAMQEDSAKEGRGKAQFRKMLLL